MRLIFFFVSIFLFSNASIATDDHKILDELTAESEQFFKSASAASKILFNYDANGSIQKANLTPAETRTILKEYKELNVHKLWSYREQQQCDTLSVSTSGRGACASRALYLALATFKAEFKVTKLKLRKAGDMGIEAAKKLSLAVKSYTPFITATCDLRTAIAWGGTGQGIDQLICITEEIYKGAELLEKVRLIAEEGDRSYRSDKIKESAKAHSAAKWQTIVEKEVSYFENGRKSLLEQANEFFGTYSSSPIDAAKDALKNSDRAFNLMKVDYCEAYSAILYHKSFRNFIRQGDQMQGYCMYNLAKQRNQELYSVKREYVH